MRILLDTNVILRFLIPHEESLKQHLQAKKLMKDMSDGKVLGLLSVLVIQEILWVAESVYHLERKRCVRDVISLCEYKGIKILEIPKKILFSILIEYRDKNVDLVDAYLGILGKVKNRQVASFDQDFNKLSAPLYNWN